MYPMRGTSIAVLLLLAGACGGDEPAPAPPASTGPPVETPREPPQPPDEPAPDPAQPIGKGSGASNAGTYRVTWQSEPAPVPLNATFALEVEVADAAGGDVSALELVADAAMPDHGHGMKTQPRVTRLGPGRFRVEGMQFHMPGYWELYFDLARGPLRERAQFAIELE
jgi:hypothetical protein